MHSSSEALDKQPDESTEPPAPSLSRRQRYGLAGGIVAAMVIIGGAGLAFGGEIGHFALLGLPHQLFLLLALVGVLGKRYTWARWLSYGYALLLLGLFVLFTLDRVLLGLLEGPVTPTSIPLKPGSEIIIGLLLLLLVVFFFVCSAVLFRPVRERLTRWLPIDPGNHTHTIALWLLPYMTVTAFALLILLGGQPPLLTAISSGTLTAEDLGNRSELGQNLDLVYGLIWMLPLAFVAAGWPLERGLRATLQRLGLVLPTRWQLLFAIAAALGLAFMMVFVTEGISTIWQWFGWPQTDEAAFEQLLGGLVSPVGALVIGFTAGLGEELAVRGLLQPRLGLVLSNLAFTAMHAYQYSFDALLVVFLLGMLLGLVRNHTNTTTAAIVHGGYNTASMLAAIPGG